jgi:UV DNA damage endonuclease
MYNRKHGIQLFRVSSDIFPLITHSEITFEWKNRFRETFDEIKALVSDSGMRLSMHPGQYTVLNSGNKEVVDKAVIEIDHHSEFLSCITPDGYAPVVLHVNSARGDKKTAISRFKKGFERLSDDSKKRLCLENDEKGFAAGDVYDLACELDVPCIFDNLHNSINPSFELSDKEIIEIFSKTYVRRRQKIHYSQQAEDKRPGAHSVTISHREFLRYYREVSGEDLDIMLEVKDKDLSCIKCMNCLDVKNSSKYREWARYKYFVMEKDIGAYHSIGGLFNSGGFDFDRFYSIIDEAIKKEPDRGLETNAVMHVWGYFKKLASDDEKKRYARYIEKINDVSIETIKTFLFSLAVKYDIGYLKESIYFFGGIYKK